MGIFESFDIIKNQGKQYLKDAFGGLLNPEWTPERAKTAGSLLLDFTPVVGDIKSAYEGVQAAKEGDYLGAGLGALGALPLVPNMAGMFIGKGAKTWDAVKASQAMDMEKAGVDPRKIWSETGNWKGPDGHWRQEIPDNTAMVDMTQVAKPFPGKEGVTMGSGNARDMLRHPELWNQYTNYESRAGNLGGYATNVVHDPKFLGPEGELIRSTNTINMKGGNSQEITSGLLHEAQHAIQGAEGWATGGNSFTAPMAVERAKNDALIPLWRDNNMYDELSKEASKLSHFNYLKKLETLSKKERIKPSDITNMSPWYEYSDDIRQWLGPMPKKAGSSRDSWLRDAAARMLFREKAKSPYGDYIVEEQLGKDAGLLKREYDKVTRQRMKYVDGAKKYAETEKKFNEISGMSDFQQYRRLAGEAEARATEARMNMDMAERLRTFPADSYDVPLDQLIIRGLLNP